MASAVTVSVVPLVVAVNVHAARVVYGSPVATSVVEFAVVTVPPITSWSDAARKSALLILIEISSGPSPASIGTLFWPFRYFFVCLKSTVQSFSTAIGIGVGLEPEGSA